MRTTILFAGLLLAAISTAKAEPEVKAVQCYEGRATVKQAAPADMCTAAEKGYANTGKGPLTHPGCTAAKNQAATKLRARLKQSCKAYVQTNQPCNVITVASCT